MASRAAGRRLVRSGAVELERVTVGVADEECGSLVVERDDAG
jgi:hypothetical protein